MIAVAGGGVLALCFVSLGAVLLRRRRAVALPALLALAALVIGPAPLTRALRISDVPAADAPARPPGIRLPSLETSEGQMTFQIDRTGLRVALHENASPASLRVELRQTWPPMHAEKEALALCGDSNFNPCPPELHLNGDRRLAALDAVSRGSIVRIEARAGDAATAEAVRPKTATIETGGLRPAALGMLVWVLALVLLGLAVANTFLRRQGA